VYETATEFMIRMQGGPCSDAVSDAYICTAQELYKQMTWDAATHSSRFAAPAMVTPLLSPPPSPKPEPANGSSGSDGGRTHFP